MSKAVRTGATLNFDSKIKFKNYLKDLQVMPSQYNRDINEAHITSMQRSIEILGIQRGIVVIVTDAFNGTETRYIADGQHLREAILNAPNKDLDGHLNAFENHIDKIEDIIPFVSRMNSTAKNWSLEEYLNSWCTHGKEDYLYLRKVQQETKHSLNGLVEAFQGGRTKGNRAFKQGQFKANKELGCATLESYDMACEMGLYRNQSSFLAFVRFVVDHKDKLNFVDMLNIINRNKRAFSVKNNREFYFGLFRGLCKPN